jgi:type VI protein secretion system component VasF
VRVDVICGLRRQLEGLRRKSAALIEAHKEVSEAHKQASSVFVCSFFFVCALYLVVLLIEPENSTDLSVSTGSAKGCIMTR